MIYKDNKYQCNITCDDEKYRTDSGSCEPCTSGKHPNIISDAYEAYDCVSNTTAPATDDDAESESEDDE